MAAQAVLAPFYDTLSMAVNPTLTQKMAMKICSKYKLSEVQVRYWEQFADSVGLTKAQGKSAHSGDSKVNASEGAQTPVSPRVLFCWQCGGRKSQYLD